MNIRRDFHIHGNYNDHSDRNLTIKNAIEQAKKIGLECIAFTEHVRRSSGWVDDYINEIEYYKKKNKIEIIIGFEAKILSDGNIDCTENIARKFFIIASFHTAFPDKTKWLELLKKAIKNEHVNVIGHLAPENYFEICDHEIEDIGNLIRENNKIVELNAKYRRPPEKWIRIFLKNGVKFHLGSDAHSLYEIGRFESINNLIQIVDEFKFNHYEQRF